jgi:hypothetical protein
LAEILLVVLAILPTLSSPQHAPLKRAIERNYAELALANIS